MPSALFEPLVQLFRVGLHVEQPHYFVSSGIRFVIGVAAKDWPPRYFSDMHFLKTPYDGLNQKLAADKFYFISCLHNCKKWRHQLHFKGRPAWKSRVCSSRRNSKNKRQFLHRMLRGCFFLIQGDFIVNLTSCIYFVFRGKILDILHCKLLAIKKLLVTYTIKEVASNLTPRVCFPTWQEERTVWKTLSKQTRTCKQWFMIQKWWWGELWIIFLPIFQDPNKSQAKSHKSSIMVQSWLG